MQFTDRNGTDMIACLSRTQTIGAAQSANFLMHFVYSIIIICKKNVVRVFAL